MNKTRSLIVLLLVTMMLVSCGGSNPAISHIIVKSDRLGVLLDTKDNDVISKLQTIFYEKEEKPDSGPEFRYFVDFTIGDEKERWQYSIDGFIRNYNEGNSMIYQLRDVAEFNRIAKIR